MRVKDGERVKSQGGCGARYCIAEGLWSGGNVAPQGSNEGITKSN